MPSKRLNWPWKSLFHYPILTCPIEIFQEIPYEKEYTFSKGYSVSDTTWFQEVFYRKSAKQGFSVKEKLHEEQSEYQKIEVYESPALGRLLTLDGKTMVSNLDEFVYHEVLSHTSYMTCPSVKNVLIIGGGDAGLVREFVKYPEIESIELVEIDERVIEVTKEYFPQLTTGLADPRVKVLPTDGIEFIKSKTKAYDIIIIDSTDPEGFALGLFSKDFYAAVSNALKENGVMMNQIENTFYDEFNLKQIIDNLKSVFKSVNALTAPMPIYPGVHWSFGHCTQSSNGREIISSKIPFMSELQKSLKWYNMDWMQGAFNLSNHDKKTLGL